MHVIKLDAIGSTNDYLKELLQNGSPGNFTVVTARTQTNGRGQMGAKWLSEPGKNLTMSVLVNDSRINLAQLFDLNVAVATAIIKALENFQIPELSIKWPNDIMSGKKKLGGILIENSVKTADDVASVIGIGLNVNQLDFNGLPNASSLAVVTQRTFDMDELMLSIVVSIQSQLEQLRENPENIWENFDSKLFRKGKPTTFEDASGNRFMGMIDEAGRDGKLYVKLEDDSVKSFGIKQITMLY
ncbi:MAG: biotin--[acetyl-CoA-carboxylase] ligase [Flavobacterium sp.]|uniref:biotin--[acetyl-CoA-carboxylase] ligase n=1 Tax=Flavobacterium sp. TaxID=239 RepID=UPI00122ACFDC|nr:biotin--[acetyl-CoA-carboxylase] ligase [Flavobacterium sp.]RZJ65746.1 MAG: biotin--[acetyl-CoA-carboxylase] ligase [Flavobacterium sp.]